MGWWDGLSVRSFVHSIVRSLLALDYLDQVVLSCFGLVWFYLFCVGLLCVDLIRYDFFCVCGFRMGVARFVGLGVFCLVWLVWFVSVGLVGLASFLASSSLTP